MRHCMELNIFQRTVGFLFQSEHERICHKFCQYGVSLKPCQKGYTFHTNNLIFLLMSKLFMLWRRKWVFYYPSKTNTFWNGDIFSNIRHALIDNGNTSLILIYRYRYIFFISCPGYNHISFCIICRTCFEASILLFV
jgi:hypothetical protein